MTTKAGGDVVHGPYLISKDPVQIKAGASISFDWRAVAGADAYDIYAYLLNTDTGATIPLLNQTGSGVGDTGWQTVTNTVNTAGNYKFVFISGTFDESFGTAAGASLLVDNVSISNNDIEPASSSAGKKTYVWVDGANKNFTTTFSSAKTFQLNGVSGHLLMIESQEEQSSVLNWLNQNHPSSVWLGISDAGSEGTWKFQDGSNAGKQITFTNWVPGEPNGGSSENYVLMNELDGKWLDYPDASIGVPNGNHGFVVEFNDTSGGDFTFYQSKAWSVGSLNGSATNVFTVNAGTGSGAFSAFAGRSTYISFGGNGASSPAGLREFTIGTAVAPLDLREKGSISFDLIKGTDSNGGESPETGEDLSLLYSTDNGVTFKLLKTFSVDDQSLSGWTEKTVTLPEAAQKANIILKFQQASASGGSFDTWGLANISIDPKLVGSSTLPANPIVSNSMTISGSLGTATINIQPQSSAREVVADINSIYSDTGVRARAITKVKLSNVASAGTLQMDLYGKNAVPQRVSATIADPKNLSALVNSFNSFSAITGIIAELSTDKTDIILTNNEGYDIGIENFSHNGATKTIDVIGLRADGSDDGDILVKLIADSASDSTRVLGTISFSSSSAFTVKETSGNSKDDAFIGADLSASILTPVSTVSLQTQDLAEKALSILDGGLAQISAQCGSLGAISSRLDKVIEAVTSSFVNTATARSQILDTDYAQEASALAKAQIIAQASTAMLAQANQSQSQVMQLLKS